MKNQNVQRVMPKHRQEGAQKMSNTNST